MKYLRRIVDTLWLDVQLFRMDTSRFFNFIWEAVRLMWEYNPLLLTGMLSVSLVSAIATFLVVWAVVSGHDVESLFPVTYLLLALGCGVMFFAVHE